jgi:OOP family OmpA-OmpF porin
MSLLDMPNGSGAQPSRRRRPASGVTGVSRETAGLAGDPLANLAQMRGRGWCLSWLLLGLLASEPVRAADVPSLSLRRLDLPTDEAGGLYTEPTKAPGPLNWNAALVASYAHRLVVLEDGQGVEVAVPVRHQLSLDYLFGLGLGDRVALGLALPSVVYQDGTDVSDRLNDATALPTAALGDVALSAKAILLPSGDLGGFALGALGKVTLPTGDPTSYVSEGSATGELRVLSELSLVALTLRATLGAKVRGRETTYVDHTFGHELPWGAALVLRPQALGWDQNGRWAWSVESHGAVALTPTFAAAPGSPTQIAAVARYTPGEVSILAGVEAPIGSAVGVPSVRGVLGFGWAPRFHDADKDGIEDAKDECAELAEDRDGFQDADGCLDFDNDDDGVGDDSDKCPTEKEDTDGFEDEDGCLDPDDDHDGIADGKDACPREAGPDSTDPKLRGCAPRDRDMDGVYEPTDKCPKKAEDRDGFEDEDGCPDPDNDGDRVKDESDACPALPGIAREDAKLSGCPSPDKDGDSYDDAVDKCPEAAETFDGFEDEDGCPDADAKTPRPPLVRVDEKTASLSLGARANIAFEKAPRTAELTAPSRAVLRAVVAALNEKPGLLLLVGVRPKNATPAAEQEALSQSSAIVLALRALAYRDDVAESVSFSVVAKLPGAQARGIGFATTDAATKPIKKPSTKP